MSTSAAAAPVCIVTGGGGGIGRACAECFAQHAYRVLVVDVDDAAATAATRELRRRSASDVAGFACDVASADACAEMAAMALERWGRIDTLVGNAGIQTPGRLIDATEAEWERIVSVNLKGIVNSCRAVLPAMIAQHDGRIVLVSSINALRAPAGMALYDMTKAGVLGLMRSLAVDHGRDGVRVNAICPGATLTDHHIRAAVAHGLTEDDLRRSTAGYGVLGRAAEPAEVAAAIHFLASDAASFITGATLVVDGGYTVRG